MNKAERGAESEPAPQLEAIGPLLHCNFDVLTPEAKEAFHIFLAMTASTSPAGEFIVQYYIDSDSAKLADPNYVSWVALHYYYKRGEGSKLAIGSDPRFIANHETVVTIEDVPKYADMPLHVIEWPKDIEYPLVQAWNIAHDFGQAQS